MMLLKAVTRIVVVGTTLLARPSLPSLSAGSIITVASQESDDHIHEEEGHKAMLGLSRSIPDQRLLVPSITGAASVDAPTDVEDSQTTSGRGAKAGKEISRLVIAVISARPERRKAIRETWWSWSDDRVVLRFFTEPPEEESEGDAAALAEEMKVYGDLVVQNIERGMNFGLKILESMRWMSDHYSFDYYLRLDDDSFLCLRRLADELDCLHAPDKSPPAPIYSGFRHCDEKREVSFVDESYLLLSGVIVQRILSASNLVCSTFGSLTLAAWVSVGSVGNPEGDVTHVMDYRLDRFGRWVRRMDRKSPTYGKVCEKMMSIHQTYYDDMYNLWNAARLTNGSRTHSTGCESFSYLEDRGCQFGPRGIPDEIIREDHGQPCDSYRVPKSTMYCGHQGCWMLSLI